MSTKSSDKYQSTLTALLSEARPASLCETESVLFGVAFELDDLIARIKRDSREVAEQFSRFAERLQPGDGAFSPPTRLSTIADVERMTVQLNTTEQLFYRMLRVVKGTAFAKTFAERVGGGL